VRRIVHSKKLTAVGPWTFSPFRDSRAEAAACPRISKPLQRHRRGWRALDSAARVRRPQSSRTFWIRGEALFQSPVGLRLRGRDREPTCANSFADPAWARRASERGKWEGAAVCSVSSSQATMVLGVIGVGRSRSRWGTASPMKICPGLRQSILRFVSESCSGPFGSAKSCCVWLLFSTSVGWDRVSGMPLVSAFGTRDRR